MSTIINYFCGIWTHTIHISSLRMWESLSPLSYCWRWEQYAKFISYTSQGLCVWGHWSLGPVSYNYTPQGPSHDSRVHLPFGPCTVCVTHSCFLSLCPRGLPLCQEPFYWHFSLPFFCMGALGFNQELYIWELSIVSLSQRPLVTYSIFTYFRLYIDLVLYY